MPLLHRGGLNLISERDQRSHVRTTYAQNTTSGTQTTIAERIAAVRSRIRDFDKEIMVSEMDLYKITPVPGGREGTQLAQNRHYAHDAASEVKKTDS
jgi:hypothetical protein